MIKPTSLWNFIHECEAGDAEYIGRVCLALAGKDVSFSRAERIQYAMIAKDSRDMDENIEAKREADKERKRAYRERGRTRTDADERGRTRTDADERGRTRTDSPSPITSLSDIQSSDLPSERKEEDDAVNACACARDGRKPPTLDEVLSYAADATHHPNGREYPADWATEWYAFMNASDPPFTDKRGVAVANWKQKMIAAWTLREKDERRAAAQRPCAGRDGIERGAFANQTDNKRGLD